MIGLVATAIAVVLVHGLLASAVLQAGLGVGVAAPAVFAVATGLGLLGRPRLHVLAYASALAVLHALRGPVAELVAAGISGETGTTIAAAVSLAPVGFVLGRLLGPLATGGPVVLALGACVGSLAVLAGVVSWLPGAFTGLAAAGAFAGLSELGRERRHHRDAGADAEHPGWEGVPFGFALGVAWLTLRRVVPGYVTPPPHAGEEVFLALLLPALVVAWPAAVLASSEGTGRVVRAVGLLAVGYGLWRLAGSLTLYQHSMPYVSTNTSLRQLAARWGPPVTEWRAWLVVFSGLPAACLGVALGALRPTARGPLLLGLGAAFLSQAWILRESSLGPQQLLVAAAGVAAVGALVAWSRWAVLAVPVGVAAVLLFPEDTRSAYDAVRRVGEPAVESAERRLPADIAVFSSFGPDTAAVQARRVYGTTFTHRLPLGEARVLAGEPWAEHHGHAHDDEPAPPPLLADPSGDADLLEPEVRHYGVRVAGVPAHPGHDPLGAEGSVGRLQRLFARRGRAFVTGVGAELVAAELVDAGLAEGVDVSSPMPFGDRPQRVLLALVESAGMSLPVRDDPLRVIGAGTPASYATVVVAPEDSGWPGAGIVSAEESLAGLAALVAPGGRCLAWLETASLDARALAARVAAFGAVFGERSAAFVEPRGLDAPLVLLVGWVDDSGRPTAAELEASLPTSDATGRRTRLAALSDLGALLVLDGAGVAEVASSSARLTRATPRPPAAFTSRGWAAVGALLGRSRALDTVVAGGPRTAHELTAIVEGLALHDTYAFGAANLSSSMLVEIVDDVDWAAFDREVAAYARAAASDRQNPLLHHALASLLSPIAGVGDATRFVEVFEATDAASMESWRLAALEAHVRRTGLQEAEADAALARARRLAGTVSPAAR